MSKIRIEVGQVTDDIQKIVDEGFARHALEKVGFDGDIQPFSIIAYEGDTFAGIAKCKTFWGAVHIIWLYVQPAYRDLGIGMKLMKAVEDYAKERGCKFAFIETMSYQAPEFYKKLGYKIEFSRSGYAANTTFHYLKKDL
jgi:ribosomal protein S18 acetylase RimI-like enzyme